MIARRRLPVKQNPQSFLHCCKIAENRRKTQKRCKLGVGWTGKTIWNGFRFALAIFSGNNIYIFAFGATAFAERSAAMKAPVGLLSGRAVCISRWRGFAPTSSAERSKRYFHRGGRKGKRHLQRRCGKVFGQTARFTGALAPPWGSCRAATEGLRMEKRKKR